MKNPSGEAPLLRDQAPELRVELARKIALFIAPQRTGQRKFPVWRSTGGPLLPLPAQ